MNRRFYFQWHLTERCNLHCVHCYQHDNDSSVVNWDDCAQVVDRIDQALGKWQLPGRIAITGGEPFLVSRFHDMLGLIDSRPWLDFFDILSNGTLIDLDVARTCAKYSRLRRVQVSLDGATSIVHDAIRGAGAFDRAIAGLEALQVAGVATSLMFTLFKSNRHQIGEMLELAHRLGCESISVERLVPIGRGALVENECLAPEELMDAYTEIWETSKRFHALGRSIKILKFRTLWAAIDPEHTQHQANLTGTLQLGASCSIGLDALAIMPDMTVYPCRRLPIPIGNLREDSLFKIWYGSDLLWKLRNKRNLAPKCGNCDLVALCGGCRAVAFASTGDVLAADPQCFYEPERL